MTGIYLIKNLISNKVYIGQSTDIKRRYSEHLRASFPEIYIQKNKRDNNTPIHLAINKYGKENFELVILEECDRENLNDKEIYWINYYCSNDKNKGYNISSGGQKTFGLKGEFHSQAKLTQKQVNEIIVLLKTTDLSTKDIANRYKITSSSVSNINTGKSWFNENNIYPIKKTQTGSKGSKNHKSKFTEDQIMEIRNLYSTDIDVKDIIEKYSYIASPSAIESIIYGRSWKHLPIYKRREKEWVEPCID